MIKQPNNDIYAETAMLLVNETTRTTVKSKWIFEIFHGNKRVYGIRQIEINGSKNQSNFIGTPQGKAIRIEIMDGERVEKLKFSGLN